MDIDCVLLAGGSSKRMGEPKLLIEMEGRTLFEHVLGVHLASSVRRICAVVPGWLRGFEELVTRLASDRVEFAILEREGVMSESLKAGWKHVVTGEKPDAVMISLADKPLVTSEIIDAVIDGFRGYECEICLPVFGGERGHPVIVSVTLEGDVLSLEGDNGARTVVGKHPERVVEVPVDSDGILVDVDTHGDLEEVRRRLDQVG
jgi:molybdenum cofactor cytidylyltransferase